MLLRHCGLAIAPERFRAVVAAYSFENVTQGRRLGEVDVTAHERQGLPGDWRNHFTSRVKTAFKERYGDLLLATGYERDSDW